MARRDTSGLYFSTDMGPVPTPPGPEDTSSKTALSSSGTDSRVTNGIRAMASYPRLYIRNAEAGWMTEGSPG